MSEKLHGDILACLPQLSAFARRLARDRSTAEDLVQSAIVRALVHADQFQPGTNFRAWITTILRNAYLNELRARDYRATVDTDVDACAPPSHGGQEERLRFRDVRRALRQLPPGQRRALLLVGAEGRSYEEAARVTAAPSARSRAACRAPASSSRRCSTRATPPARSGARCRTEGDPWVAPTGSSNPRASM